MNNKPFLITGLPRSATAWLSVVMTTDKSICYHDIISERLYESNFEWIKPIWLSPYGYNHIGVSDSGAGFILPWIREEIRPNVLIVERDINEVIKSVKESKHLSTDNIKYVYNLQDNIDDFCLTNKGSDFLRTIPFEELFDVDIIVKLMNHLIPNCITPDTNRISHLIEMNIQRIY